MSCHAVIEFVNPADLEDRYNMRVLHKDPLVVEFTDFVSQEEIDALIGMALWQYRQPSWFDHVLHHANDG